MTTITEAQLLTVNKPAMAFEIDVDQCTLENGVGACTAVTPCYYTYPSCPVQDVYVKGMLTLIFTEKGHRVPNTNYLPYLTQDIIKLPTKIDSSKTKIERAEMRITLKDDAPMVTVAENKTTAQDENISVPSMFWARFLARNPNLKGRIGRLKYGFIEVDYTDWLVQFEGKIEDVQLKLNSIEIRILDRLAKLTETKMPNKIASTNILKVNYNGGAVMNVMDVSEFADATVNQPRCVKLNDEYVSYTGKIPGLNQLTGCVPGAYLTTPISHPAGTKAEQVVVFGNNDYNGWTADRIFMDLFTTFAKVPADKMKLEDNTAATLTAGITDADDAILVTGLSYSFGSAGIIMIESEMIYYAARTAAGLTGCLRGMYGTTAAAHLINTDVYITNVSFQCSKWHDGALFRRKIEGQKSVGDIIQDLRESTLVDNWQGEDGFIRTVMQSPALYEGQPPAFTLTNLADKSRKVDLNPKAQATRVYLYWSPNKIDPSDNEEDYSELYLIAGPGYESEVYYDDIKPKSVFSPFIYRDAEADWLTRRLYKRFVEGVPIVTADYGLVDEPLAVGQLIDIRIPERCNPDGSYKIRLYRVVSKERVKSGAVRITAEDAGFGGSKYKLIGPLNSVLDQIMDAVQVTMDVDISGTSIALEDWRTGGTHALRVISPGTTNETITYTGITDLGGGVIRFTGLARGVESGGLGFVHAVGDEILMLHSAASDAFRFKYGWFGDPVNNKVSGSGVGVLDMDGYNLW